MFITERVQRALELADAAWHDAECALIQGDLFDMMSDEELDAYYVARYGYRPNREDA